MKHADVLVTWGLIVLTPHINAFVAAVIAVVMFAASMFVAFKETRKC